MTKIMKDLKVKVNPNFIHRNVAGSDMLISIGSNIANLNGYIEMNESAAFMWENMNEETTVGKLVELLAKEYEINEEQAYEDVCLFVEELKNNGMLENN